jgi:uncharacterized protein
MHRILLFLPVDKAMADFDGCFAWYELMTTNVEAATAFYAAVIGWDTRDASTPGMTYTLFAVEEHSVCGSMEIPQEAAKKGVQPRWLGYVGVDNVDAVTREVERLGGSVHVPPTDIPAISRFSIVADPQMATFALIGWRPGREGVANWFEPGGIGWHELLAVDADRAFSFYGSLLGWRKAKSDIGPPGTYGLLSVGGKAIGGIFNKPPVVPHPFWLFYFSVGDIDAAAERVKFGGGQILEGPLEVPAGGRVARCVDPQGAMFAMIGTRSDKPVGYFARGESGVGPRGGRQPK